MEEDENLDDFLLLVWIWFEWITKKERMIEKEGMLIIVDQILVG